MFGFFNIGMYYQVIRSFLILISTKPLALECEKYETGGEVYKKVRDQLIIIHEACIIHGGISQLSIRYWRGKVYFIGFWYSKYADDDREAVSRSMLATVERMNKSRSRFVGQTNSGRL